MSVPIHGNAVNDITTLELPYPRLTEGRFLSVHAFTDETLYEVCHVRIAFTCRDGGVSAAPFDSLNLGDHVHDDLHDVQANRARVLEAFGCALSVQDSDIASCEGSRVALLNPLQVHERTVLTCRCVQDMPEVARVARQGCDGIVATDSRIPVLLCFADCVPVIIVAPTGAFAVVHAGWRGVVNGIVAQAAQDLMRETGVSAAACNVYIGPYIHACHFEVGPSTAQAFRDTFGAGCFVDATHVDMGAALRMTLMQTGFDPNRIADVDVCTVDNQDLFFSYRGAQGVCGRHGAFAVCQK